MSDLNTKAANAAAISRQRCGSLLFLALLFIVPVRAGLPQTNVSSKGPILSGQGAVLAQRQTLDYAAAPGSAGLDPVMAERRMKMLNNERRKSLLSDTEKLLKLATELNNEIGRSNSGSLSPDQLRKVAEIEKLAHNVRDKMTMTIVPPSAPYFPITGPQ
jgi:hypothetical protein